MNTDYPLIRKQPPRSRWQAHGQRYLRRWGLATHDEAGLTLIECLAAIVVVGFIGAAIAPVLVISVATRVQSQKAEQALALAQSEIDFIRTLLERGGDLSAVPLPPIDTSVANNTVATADGPSQRAADGDRYPAALADARPVDVDDDGEADFGVQVYRTTPSGTGDALAFSLGVRVYDIEAINNASGALSTEQASIGLASGQGDRTTQPLATLYSTIASGEDTQSLCTFADFLGGYEEDEIPTGCPQP